MKAIIVEISKDYCIVMTRDGQFLKQRIPPGFFELGDEIIVSKEYVYKSSGINVPWIKKMSLAASLAVMVITVSIFSFFYIKQYTGSRDADFQSDNMVIEETTGEGNFIVEEIKDEGYEESRGAVEESAEEGTGDLALSEAVGQEAIVFEKIYSFDEQTEAEDNIKNVISFSYKIINNASLRIELRNISTSSNFSGTLNMIISLSDNSEKRTEEISLEDFKPGEIEEYPLFLKTGESKLKVEVNGFTH
jgi:hypothetical protein